MTKNPQLVKLAQRHPAFEALYKAWALPLMKFLVSRMGGDRQAAEEVFAQTVLAAWKGWHSFEHKSTYFTWVCKIGLRKMADYYKDQINDRSHLIYPTVQRLADYESSELSMEEKMAIHQLRVALGQCLNLLPDRSRELLKLKYWQDLTNKAIAQTLGISERAVEGQLYRSRLALKEIIVTEHPELLKSLGHKSLLGLQK